MAHTPTSFGQRGEHVSRIHHRLRLAGADLPASELEEQVFGRETRGAVLMVQKRYGLQLTGEVDVETHAVLFEQVTEAGGPAPPASGAAAGRPAILSIGGTVVDAEMAPLGGAQVIAYNQQLNALPELARVRTGADGRYHIVIRATEPANDASTRRSAGQINLLVRAYHPDDVQVAESDVFYKASGIRNVDLAPPGATYRGPSEAELVGEVVAASLNGAHLAGLTLDDIDFLARSTGGSNAQITALVGASALGAQTGLPSEIFYGLARAGFPSDLAELYKTTPKVRRRALDIAFANNTIPARLLPQLDDVLGKLQAATVKAALSTATNGRPTLGTLLATTALSQDQQAQFLSKFSAHTGNVGDFWTALAQDPQFTGDSVPTLQFTLQAGALTLNHAPLVRLLQQQRRDQAVSGLRDLARLNQDGWKVLINGSGATVGAGVPAEITGRTPDERATTYARILSRIVDDAFPTAALGRRLGEQNATEHADVKDFIEKNPGFDFHTAVIDQYAQSAKTDTRVVPKLKAVQRLFRLSSEADHITTLLNDGIHSSHQIVRMGKTQFAKKYGGVFGGAGKAEAIHARATTIAMTAQNLFANFNQAYNGVLPALVKKNKPATLSLPDLETLFGHLNFSTTDECSSVLGPAAYLADILHFLRDRLTQDGTQSAKDLLFARRPDIGQIELTCDNTDTPLPYTDLVNEILENSIAPLPFGAPIVLLPDLQALNVTQALIDAFANHNITLTSNAVIRDRSGIGTPGFTIEDAGWRHAVDFVNTPPISRPMISPWPQTSGSAEQRAANPEHLNSAAYDVLAQAVFPWFLPLNLWAETARAYLGYLGVGRDVLMAALAPSGPMPAALSIAINSEALKLTTLERQIVAGTTGRPLSEFWSAASPPPATWTTDLAVVRNFEIASGLLYVDILDVLASRYANPGELMNIQSSDPTDPLTTDTTKLEITNLTTDALDRIHRFVRLATKLGWSYRELDLVLSAFGPGFAGPGATFQDNFVVGLAIVAQLRTTLGLSIEQLLSFWFPINTVGASSLYLTLFQNPSILNPTDPDFALNAAGTELAIVAAAPANAKISKHIPTILASLSISAKDLAAITALDIADDALSLANLSEIYRLALLSKATTLSIADVLRLREISGLQPFDAGNPVAAQAFIQLSAELGRSGFSLDELDYILRARSVPGSSVAPLDQTVALTLDDIYNGLLRTPDPTSQPNDPVGTLTRAALSKLPDFTDDLVNEAMAVVDGSSTATAAAQDAFIDANFASFIDPTDAKAQLVGPPALIAQAPARFSYVLFALQTSAVLAARRNLIKQKLSIALKLPLPIADRLLRTAIKSTITPGMFAMDDFLALAAITKTDPKQPLTAAQCAGQITTYDLLAKVSTVVVKFRANAAQVGWLTAYGPAVGWLDFNALPTSPQPGAAALFAAWKRTADLFALSGSLPGGSALLDLLFAMARDPSMTEPQLLAALADRTGWLLDDLQTLVGPQALNLAFPAAYLDERGFALLKAAVAPLLRMKVSASMAIAWTKPDLVAGDAQAMIQTVKAKYDDATWNAIAKPLRDVLREMQRAALVDYRLVRPDPSLNQAWTTTNEMFDWFLIDVEMTPAMVTSRIKQAISSTQLFVQRIRLNLEIGIVADETADDIWKQWLWMKNYRVWEANREVFLWAERWADPALRDGKTPEFLQLENEILKNQLTDSLATDSIIHYLEALDQIARLEICGMCHQIELDDNENVSKDVMHVFGRTYGGKAQVYYYRTWDAISGFWSPWLKVNLDIDTQHLVPVIYEGRLFLFWSIFTKTSNNPPFTMPAPNDTVSTSSVYWDIAIAYSVLHNNKWSAKKLSGTSLSFPTTPVDQVTLQQYDPSSFTFRPQQYYESQMIYCYWFTNPPPPPPRIN
jgi:peptidoglycan hydrolase-like protein with peptidoglycan-binding domain